MLQESEIVESAMSDPQMNITLYYSPGGTPERRRGRRRWSVAEQTDDKTDFAGHGHVHGTRNSIGKAPDNKDGDFPVVAPPKRRGRPPKNAEPVVREEPKSSEISTEEIQINSSNTSRSSSIAPGLWNSLAVIRNYKIEKNSDVKSLDSEWLEHVNLIAEELRMRRESFKAIQMRRRQLQGGEVRRRKKVDV